MAESLPRVGFAGMTHLGLVSAVAAAEHGFEVTCFDRDGDGIRNLREGNMPVVEPRLAELAAGNGGRLCFVSDLSRLQSCDIVYIAPDVPTNDQGLSDLIGIKALIKSIVPALSEKSILVILCQVPPGFTRAIEFDSERLYYQVETLIFGRAIERALHPERTIIGAANPKMELPPAFARHLAAYDCPILRMRYESAELAKISINMCLVASITTANMLAEICENIGADWSEIVPALKLDRRIGAHAYLAPGLGISGGNLERDLATIIGLGAEYGCDVATVRNWQRNSRYRRDWVLRQLYRYLGEGMKNPVIAVLGLAYKPDTDSVKNSPATALVEALWTCDMRAYDPVACFDPGGKGRFRQYDSAIEACAGADAVVMMTPWQEFYDLAPRKIAAAMSGRLVVDPFRVLDAEVCAVAGLRHVRLGIGA